MKRRFFTIFSAVAFLAFFAVSLLWIRFLLLGSEYVVYLHLSSSRIRIDIDQNRVTVGRFAAVSVDRSLPVLTVHDVSIYADDTSWRRREQEWGYGDLFQWAPQPHSVGGFGFATGIVAPVPAWNPAYPTSVFRCPVWFVVLIFGLPLIVPMRRVSRIRLRERHRLCGNCGYDIRASTDNCPECGMRITEPKVNKGQAAIDDAPVQ